jgi:hypothetical protein
MRTTKQKSQIEAWSANPRFGRAERRRLSRLPAASDDLTNKTLAVHPLPQGLVAGSRPKTLKCAQVIIKTEATVGSASPSLLGEDMRVPS